MIFPSIARHTIGVVAVGARRYIDWFGALYRSVFILVAPRSPSFFISLISTPISLDTSPSLAGVCQSGLHGTHSLIVDKINLRRLRVCKSSSSSADYFSAFHFVLGFCFLKNSQFNG